MDKETKVNKYGYHELINKPTESQLSEYYAEKYYQAAEGGYEKKYSEDEIEYTDNKINQKYRKAIDLGLISEDQTYSLLDVGCGEGFTLSFFNRLNWDITGLDYSSFGCEKFNPECSEKLKQGDIYGNIDSLIESEKKFDVIWIDNVLEHVLDPFELLNNLYKLSSEVGVLIIEVPNDFSILQSYLLQKKHIDENFWVVVPDHISYFNKEGLENVCLASNWSKKSIMGDFPIDWFLINEHSNYKSNPATGKQAHTSRIEIENLLSNISVDKTNKLFEALADLGMGRQLIGIFKKQ